jgi:uncharacterized protein (DUF58 family)
LHDPTIRWCDDFHRGEFTQGGRAMFWGMLGSGAMLMGGVTQPLAVCFAFCISALALAGIVGVYFRPRLRLTRRITAYPSVGEVFSYRVDVENVGKHIARNLIIEERGLPADLRPHGAPPMIDVLQPGQSVTVTLSLRCSSRDCFDLDRLQGASTFPGGLVKSGRKSRTSDRLVVYPSVTRIAELEVPHSLNHQPGGIALASSVGESAEFLGTRDWRQGDRVRDIHWASSARAGRLIAREFQEEYFVRLAVVLDVDAPRARDQSRLEKAISLTAGIADALARKEYIVDIFAAGDHVYHFQTGRAIAPLDNILELLASVEAGRRIDTQVLSEVLLPETSRLSAVICVMMDWDQGRLRFVRRLSDEGLAIRVICMKPGKHLEGLDATEIIEAFPTT